MNATLECAPTATTNCQCKAEWLELCDFGHYHQPNHCQPPPKDNSTNNCCFNYWWDDPMSPHGVTNLTWPTPPDDSLYLADAFSRYLHERSATSEPKPFLGMTYLNFLAYSLRHEFMLLLSANNFVVLTNLYRTCTTSTNQFPQLPHTFHCIQGRQGSMCTRRDLSIAPSRRTALYR